MLAEVGEGLPSEGRRPQSPAGPQRPPQPWPMKLSEGVYPLRNRQHECGGAESRTTLSVFALLITENYPTSRATANSPDSTWQRHGLLTLRGYGPP